MPNYMHESWVGAIGLGESSRDCLVCPRPCLLLSATQHNGLSTVNNFLKQINAQRQPITKSDNPPGNARDVARKFSLKSGV